VKVFSQPVVLVALFSLAACSGGAGTMNSSVPGGSQPSQSTASTAQSQTRATLDKDKPPHPKAKKDVDFGYTLFGDAALVHPGHNSNTAVQAMWAGPNAPYGGIDFAFPTGATYSQLQNLSSDYQFTVGSCGDGAPRFVVTLTNGTVTGNVNFYFGPPPNYTGCPPNVWTNTGNLASGLVDDSQLTGGTFYDPYAASQTKFGSYTITDVFVVVDGFTAFRTVQWDNVGVTIGTDNETYTFEKGGPDNGFTDSDKDNKHKDKD
jgi:predicted small lipoprotein YifL